MAVELLRPVLAVLATVVLPGFLLVRAVFGRRGSLPLAQEIYITLGGGVLVTMFVATILGFLPHGARGQLQSVFLGGLPFLEIGLAAACAGLLAVGLWRGAYAWPQLKGLRGAPTRPRPGRTR